MAPLHTQAARVADGGGMLPLHAAAAARAAPEVLRRFETEGYNPVGNAPEEFGRFVQAEITRWGRVVKFSGAKPE